MATKKTSLLVGERISFKPKTGKRRSRDVVLPPARPLREQATWWRDRRGSRRLHLSQNDTLVAHLDSSGAAELKLGRELAPRRPCDLHRKTADNSAARGGLVMDQRGRRRFEGNRCGACDATPCSSRRLV